MLSKGHSKGYVCRCEAWCAAISPMLAKSFIISDFIICLRKCRLKNRLSALICAYLQVYKSNHSNGIVRFLRCNTAVGATMQTIADIHRKWRKPLTRGGILMRRSVSRTATVRRDIASVLFIDGKNGNSTSKVLPVRD